MELKSRSAAGAAVLLSSASVMAQDKAPVAVPLISQAASPPRPNAMVPGDPTWLLVGLAFLAGLVIGYFFRKFQAPQNMR